MFGALFGLSKSVEARLFHAIQTQLAQADLKGFDVHIDGQTLRLGLRPDGLREMGVRTPDDLNRATQKAQKIVWGVGAGLYGTPHHGNGLLGPVTKLTLDETALADARLKLEVPPSAQDIAVAASCTQEVSRAVGQRKLNFVSDSAHLTPESAAIINDIYAAIRSCPERLVLYVEGYTDNSGTTQHNLTLSRDRAQTAANALISKGLNAKDVLVAGYGADKPIAANDDADGQAKNRRVEFTLRPR
jgi:outer membrane protein OmpA-like peptidoglycan-associated protein